MSGECNKCGEHTLECSCKGTLKRGEYHPSANSAMAYVKTILLTPAKWFFYKEALASTALSGCRQSEICLETLERIEQSQPVSDRYLLGLAWFLKELEEVSNDQ